MSKFTNFVRGELVDAIDADPATAVKITFDSPFQPPANPVGQRARLILMDDARRPTKFETISFTGYTSFDDVQTLIGVERGVDGTTAQSWSAGAVVGQDLPSSILKILLASPSNGEALMFGSDGLFEFRSVEFDELSGRQFVFNNELQFEEGTVASIPTDQVALYADSNFGDFVAYFDDSSTDIIADKSAT